MTKRQITMGDYDRAVRSLKGESTLYDEALDLLERLQDGKELTPKQQKALLNLLKNALRGVE